MVAENRHSSLREIPAELSVSHESIYTILNDFLGMKRIAARLIPKDLNFLQKLNRVKVVEDMLERVNSDPTFIKRIVTGHETWVYEFDMQTSLQASEWRLLAKPTENMKKRRQNRSKIKLMLTVFSHYRVFVHSEFLPEGKPVNKEYYLSVMKRLREQIRRKRGDLWKENSCILHHDMAPVDFFLFPKLKLPLRGTYFQSIEGIKENSRRELKSIPENAFKNCFHDWIICWHKCIISRGAYFEGDEINLDE